MRYLFLVLICSSLCSPLIAQVHFKVTENTIVKDADGTVYPYFVWKTLITQGEYEIRPIDQQNSRTDFLLVKLTEEEKNRHFEKMPKPQESEYFRTGKTFASFKTRDLNNNKIDLKALSGKIVVINFWFINCPPCRMEIPSLNQVVESFKGNDKVVFIGVALDDRYSLKEFLKSTPFNYTIVEDGRYIAQRYRINGFPTHVIINPEG